MAVDVNPFAILRGMAFCGLSLAAATAATARPAESIPVPGVEEPDGPSGFVGNDGQVVLLAKNDSGQVHLLIWKGTGVRRLDLPGALDGLLHGTEPLSDDRFVLRSVPDDGSSHGGPVSTQIYRLTGTGKARLLWTASEADYARSRIRISGDGKVWGVMAPSRAAKKTNDGRRIRSKSRNVVSGIHFAFGNFKSPKIRRKYAVMFHDWVDDRDIEGTGQATNFIFLDSDGPVLVAPYADYMYLLRFGDSGVTSQQIEPMKPLMKAVAGVVWLEWQDEDRVLWSGGTGEWLAWNLWDLGLSGFPEEPFLSFSDSYSGRPHRMRGFVRTIRDGDRYRVEHLWQNPQSPNWKERRISDWQQGTPIGFPDVSPDGRHVLVFEQRLPDEDTSGQPIVEGEQEAERLPRYYATRFELFPAPVEPPEPAP